MWDFIMTSHCCGRKTRSLILKPWFRIHFSTFFGTFGSKFRWYVFVYYLAIFITRGEGWLGFSDLWSGRKLWWNTYLTLVVNFGEVRRAQLAKSTLLTSMFGAPGIFPDLLRTVQMLKREWVAESSGKLLHLFIPSKTATLVPAFAVKDLFLDRTATLAPVFFSQRHALGQNTLIMMMMMMMMTIYLSSSCHPPVDDEGLPS